MAKAKAHASKLKLMHLLHQIQDEILEMINRSIIIIIVL